MPNIAIFDLDYTLTKRGTWGRFVILNVRTRPWRWLPLLINTCWYQWGYKRGKNARIDVKQCMMLWSMSGKTREEIEALAKDFAQKEVLSKLRPGAVRALKKHKDAGDTLIIASAAVDVIAALVDHEVALLPGIKIDREGGRVRPEGQNACGQHIGSVELLMRINQSASPLVSPAFSVVVVCVHVHLEKFMFLSLISIFIVPSDIFYVSQQQRASGGLQAPGHWMEWFR